MLLKSVGDVNTQGQTNENSSPFSISTTTFVLHSDNQQSPMSLHDNDIGQNLKQVTSCCYLDPTSTTTIIIIKFFLVKICI